MFSSVSLQRSLKFRVTLFTLALFMLSIWSLAFYASRVLRNDMERVLGEAQFSTVSYVATSINTQLDSRLRALEILATDISPALLADPGALQRFLTRRPNFQALFNAGSYVTRTDGIVMASHPQSAGRLGKTASDRDYMIAALRDGKTSVGKPIVGRASRSPSMLMAAPIRDAGGRIIGALVGVTDLAQANFLDDFTNQRYGQTGGYLLVAPQHRLIVTASDKRRIMAELPAPAPAVKGSTSRFIQGYEGYDVVVNQLGVETLASAKRIPAAGWYVAASLPTAEAFAPIEHMQRQILLAATLLTLLAGVLSWWFLRRQFASMKIAASQLIMMSRPGQPLAPIPIAAQDEVGHLIGGFNRLLESLQERKLELRLSEARFQMLASATFEGVVISAQGHVVDANEQLLAMLGYTREEVIGQPVMKFIAPEDQTRVLVSIRAGCDSQIEHTLVGQSGRRVEVEAHGKTIHDPERPLRITAVRDITQRKREAALLQQAKNEAERANNAKSRFLAAASHDLRQPLSALSLYAGLLKNVAMPSERKVVANMQVCIVGLSELLTDLLDLSKLDAGVVTAIFSDFSVAELFDSLQSVHAPEAGLKRLRLRCRPTRLTGRTDPVLLRRLLGNLMSNALRYTERGGVLVACRRRQGRVWIEVWDTGIGIAADQTQVIFEEFRQLGDQARNHGSGLGLAIVAKTATLLGLEIQVRSRPGRGSVFAIELPPGAPALAEPGAAAPVAALRLLRIALVDDNELVREALTDVLQHLGHQVQASATKAELLAGLGPFQPDIVLSDYRLTGGDTGLEVIAAVRERLGPAFPVILITGDTDPQLLRSMAELDIVVLHKSLNLDLLQATLQESTSEAA